MIALDLKKVDLAYWLVADVLNEGAIKLNSDGAIFYCNSRFAEMVKLPYEEINGLSMWIFVDPADANVLKKLMLGPDREKKEVYLHARDGSSLPVCVFKNDIRNGVDQQDVCFLLLDLSGKKSEERAHQEAEQNYQNLFENATEGMFRSTPDGRYLMANPAMVRMLHYSSSDGLVLDMEGGGFLYVDKGRRAEYMRQMLEHGAVVNFESQIYCRNGRIIWISENARTTYNADGTVKFFEGSVEDITVRKCYEAQLAFHANCDELTGLPNRHYLSERLRQAIVVAEKNMHMVTVAFIDLDQFKFINDSLGHNVGDRLLKIVAERLKTILRDGDMVARYGGDEFVFLVDQSDDAVVSPIMQRILRAVSMPIVIGSRELHITCSIGLSRYPNDGRDVESLLKNADAAMYRAKEQGRDNFQPYTQELNFKIASRLALESCLRQALLQQQFFIEYQPQIDLQTGKMVGVEALIRWRNGMGKVVGPMDFIPLAEEIGLIVPIGEWVLRTACLQNKMWQESGFSNMRVSVNLSARQFRQKNLVELIARILHETGLDPQYLDLELTESMVMQSVESVIVIMGELKSLGVRLSIDDFGTGYSSLSYLKSFPVDVLKIDKSFIMDILNDPKGAAIAPSIITLAHSLNLKVIAEGVETKEQVDFLLKHSCDEIQGYYVSKPVSADQIVRLMRQGASPVLFS